MHGRLEMVGLGLASLLAGAREHGLAAMMMCFAGDARAGLSLGRGGFAPCLSMPCADPRMMDEPRGKALCY